MTRWTSAAVLVSLVVCLTHVTQGVHVSYEGSDYEVLTGNDTGRNLLLKLADSFWWDNATAAEAACNLVNGSLGYNSDGDSPAFGYSLLAANPSFINLFYQTINDTSCSSGFQSLDYDTQYALSSPWISPSPSPEASPSPSPVPPNCSLATFNPPILLSQPKGQICASNKAVRQGKQAKHITRVALSLTDASNQPVAINITDIVTDKALAAWKCTCRSNARDNCSCLPNAVLLGGGSFLVRPQWRRSTRAGGYVDTTLQVSFTATAVGGGTCNGTAVICSAWGLRPKQPAPVCTPFNSTGATRPALTCT